MRNSSLKYGLYAAITGFVAFGLSLFLGASQVLGFIAIFIALSFVYLGIKYFRDTENNGKLHFKKALTLGMLITLLAAVGIAIMDGLYVTVFNPNFFQEYGQIGLEQAQQTGNADAITTAQEQIDQYAAMSKIQLGLFSGGFMFVLVTVIGLIVSIISGLILKKE